MNTNLSSTLDRAASLYPDKTAVIDGPVRHTYAELAKRVAAVDAGLAGLGVGAGDVVALLMLNSHRHLECWFAIPRGGAVITDLNIRLVPAEQQAILDDCGATVLIVDDAFLEVGLGLADACASVRHVVHAGQGATPEGAVAYEALATGAGRPAAVLDEDALAGIFYTGGTTGRAKGAMLTHRSLLANAKHVLIAWEYTAKDRYLHAAPMFHLADGCSTYGLTWCGGTHVIIPAFDPELTIRTIAEERVTRTLLVPTMINMVVDHPALAEHDLSSLERITYGSSPMPDELQRKAMERIDCDWLQAYGMTEASPLVLTCGVEDHDRGARGEEPYRTRLRAAGTPVVGVDVEVRRADGTTADVGEPGEIWVRGENLMIGYWKREQETADAFDADGWYRSGDAAYRDRDGYLYIVDRMKDMIISGGENVYSSEVENAIYAHPAVVEAAVFSVPDERWGERVHAAVVLRDGVSVEADAIIEHCRPLIAGYKLPRSVDIHLEPLPKSGAGKILKVALREPYWRGHDRAVS
jgi:long-chain acyl-CoA synthetase